MRRSSPQVVVAHLGARRRYAVAELLYREGFLTQLFTDTYAGEGSWIRGGLRLVPRAYRVGLLGGLERRVAQIPAEKVTAFNLLGLRYKLAKRRTQESITNTHFRYNAAFCKRVAASEYLEKANLFYGFIGSSLECIEECKAQGKVCIIDQNSTPASLMSTLIREEYNRWSGWQVERPVPWNEKTWLPREKAERGKADVIVVPANHVRSAVLETGVPPSKVVAIPYFPTATSLDPKVHSYDGRRPLRVLFVGRVSLAKGIPYLLEALCEFDSSSVQARLVGSVHLRYDKLVPYRGVVEIVGRVSPASVAGYYDWADVLVMPSICEGSALVTYEARACGLPIVATCNTGSWVRDGEDGIVVPIRDAESITAALVEFIEQPALVQRMSHAALEFAPRFSKAAYQRRLASLVAALNHTGGVSSLVECTHSEIDVAS